MLIRLFLECVRERNLCEFYVCGGEIGDDSGEVNRQTSHILVVDVCRTGFDTARKGRQKVLMVVAKRGL